MTELYNLIFDFLFHSLLIIFHFITNFMTFINFSFFPLILILSYFVLHEEHRFGQEQEGRGTNYPHTLDPLENNHQEQRGSRHSHITTSRFRYKSTTNWNLFGSTFHCIKKLGPTPSIKVTGSISAGSRLHSDGKLP